MVTFLEPPTQYTIDKEWVKEAFGLIAKLNRREFTVLAKGLLADKLRSYENPLELFPAL